MSVVKTYMNVSHVCKPNHNYIKRNYPNTCLEEKKNVSLSVMQLNSISSSKLKAGLGFVETPKSGSVKKISFGSKTICNFNMKKLMPDGSYSFIPASFSKLHNKQDVEKIFNTKMLWEKKTRFGDYIVNDFLGGSPRYESFYVTEIKDKAIAQHHRVKALMHVKEPDFNNNSLDIIFLQSSPDIVGKNPPAYKGAGELSLFGAVKMAKRKHADSVKVLSFNDKFYEKMGFEKTAYNFTDKLSVYELYSSDFNKFIERVCSKYSF